MTVVKRIILFLFLVEIPLLSTHFDFGWSDAIWQWFAGLPERAQILCLLLAGILLVTLKLFIIRELVCRFLKINAILSRLEALERSHSSNILSDREPL